MSREEEQFTTCSCEGPLDQHPGICVLVLSCCSDLKKNGTAKATEERTDPSQLPVHCKVGKSESDEAAAHSTATAGIREQWTHLAAWLPLLHEYGPNSLMQSRWPSHGCILGWSPKPSAKLRTKINHPFITWESVRKGRYQILPFALFPEFT